jgi:hypothetical protein
MPETDPVDTTQHMPSRTMDCLSDSSDEPGIARVDVKYTHPPNGCNHVATEVNLPKHSALAEQATIMLSSNV